MKGILRGCSVDSDTLNSRKAFVRSVSKKLSAMVFEMFKISSSVRR